MKPKYQINLNGSDITSRFSDRGLTITVTELEGGEGDKFELTIDDRDEEIEVPPKGEQLEIFLGYEETGIQSLGTYNIDKITLQYRPSIITLSGTSANFSTDDIKQHRNNNYENKSLNDIVSEVAGRNGLSSYIDPSLSSTPYTMLHQTDESDMSLINRLSRDHGGIFKIAGGTMIVQKRGNNQSAGGESMSVTVDPTMVKPGTVRVEQPDRPNYQSGTSGYWYNPATAKREVVKSGGGDGSDGNAAGGFTIRHPHLDQDHAQSSVDGRKDELDRDKAKASCELAIGDPSVTASGDLELAGFRDGIDGTYSIKSVEHNYDSEGYTTKITAEAGDDSSGGSSPTSSSAGGGNIDPGAGGGAGTAPTGGGLGG